MKALLNFFKSRYFLIGIGIILLVVLIWVLGKMFGVSTDMRFAATIAVLVVCLIVMALSFARANRFSSAIEQSIKQQSEQQLMNVRPDKREEIQELKEQLEVAIESLKRSKLGRGRRGKAALYALPWYVFIGPPTSGKTTAIMNSGLNFPMGMDRIRGVGGTRNCDWFFSDSAIFLDTAGRYVTEHEDREEWISFLETLKKNRPDKPINGVLVGISMTDLLGKSIDEVERHGDKIRRRIDELVSQLDIRFPVYIVFTKCDLLRGFVEFFGALDSREREQIWGCTLDKKQSEAPDIRPVFEEEFDLLVEGVVTRRSEYLSRAQKREGRHNVFAFPLEFAAAKDNLSRFVNRVFQPNPYQVTPVFRGFYFTSGTQEGIPLEGVINKIARSFGLKTSQDLAGEHGQEKKSYFIRDMFTDVVIPDQYMVSQTPGSRLRSRLQKAAFSTGAVVLLGLFILLSTYALVRSRSKLNETSTTVIAAAQVDWERRDGVIENLSNMRALDLQIESLDDWDVSLINLDRSDELETPARQVYLEKARTFVRTLPFNVISRRIRNAANNQQMDAAEQQALSEDIKAQLLMTTEVARLEEEENRRFLESRLQEIAMEDLQSSLAVAGDAQLSNQVERQIKTFVDDLSANSAAAFAVPDPGLLRQAQFRVSESPSVRNVYERILRQAEIQGLPPVSLSEVVGTSYAHMFVGNPEVPGVFTKSGWDNFVKDAIARNSENPEQDCWVTICGSTSAFSSVGADELTKQLEGLYFQEYERVWLLFMQQVRYAPANGIRSVSSKINDLSSPYTSPLLSILGRATSETTFLTEAEQASAAAGQVGGAVGQAAGQLLQSEPHPLTRSFQWLHDLQARIGVQEGPLVRVFGTLGEISRKLDELGGDPTMAAEYTRSVLTGGAELETALVEIGRLRGLNDELRRNLLEQPVSEAWTALLGETRRHLDNLWQEQVYSFYRARLAGRYPFDSGSQEDVVIEDLNQFFHPTEGFLAKFREEQLRSYLNSSWRGRRLGVSRATESAIEKAGEIARHLIEGDGVSVEFQLQPEQTELLNVDSPRPTFVRIQVHDQNNNFYDQGGVRPWEAYRWPGFPQEARIDLRTQQGNFSEGNIGEWAWWRLLSKAQVHQHGPGQFRLSWVLEQNRYLVKYNLQYGNKADLFRDVERFFTFNCPESLF